jgi:hypothetical protein
VQLELDTANASSDLRNQSLQPLQTLKRQVEAQSSIAHIDQARIAAVDTADEAFQKIEGAAKPTVTPGIGDDDPPPAYVKPRRVVKPAGLAPKALLETKEDIDAFLAKLRHALENAIDAGERVEIR